MRGGGEKGCGKGELWSRFGPWRRKEGGSRLGAKWREGGRKGGREGGIEEGGREKDGWSLSYVKECLSNQEETLYTTCRLIFEKICPITRHPDQMQMASYFPGSNWVSVITAVTYLTYSWKVYNGALVIVAMKVISHTLAHMHMHVYVIRPIKISFLHTPLHYTCGRNEHSSYLSAIIKEVNFGSLYS